MINNKDVYVSFITEMEFLCFNNFSTAEEQSIKELLAESIIVEMSLPIKQQAIEIRKTSGLKLPDSIIAASCMYMKIPLLTADSGFSRVKLLDYLHYQK